jgi:uncharacterized protein (DUF433 family)
MQAITVDPETMGGVPVFTGTRVPVQTLFEWLTTETLDAFLENFPTVSRAQALEVLRLAEQRVTASDTLHENPA